MNVLWKGSKKTGPMDILFIGKRYYTNRDALTEQYGRIFQLPARWARQGMRVRLWLLDYKGRKIERERIGMLDVLSTPIKGGAWIALWLRWLFSGLGSGYSRLILASGDCYIGLIAYALARLSGSRFVFDVYDKYDEFGGFRRILGFDPFEFLLKRSDAALFASSALLDALDSRARFAMLVPNGVDLDRFRPLDKRACREQLKLPQEIIFVGYFGSMELDRGVVDLIAAVQILRSEGMSVELLLGGRLDPSVDPKSEGVRFVGNVPFASVPSMLASCEALAVPYRRSAFMDAGASNKIAEALACGRPLVATRTPNLTENFPEQAAALSDRLAEPGSPWDLARVMRLQILDPRLVSPPFGAGWDAIADRTATTLGILYPSAVSTKPV